MSDQIRDKIKELGEKSPEEIAAFLTGMGIVGYLATASDCPVARYLCQYIPDLEHVLYFSARTSCFEICRQVEEREFISFPDSVRNFIRYFDSGKFPDLVQQYVRMKEVTP